MGYEQCRVTSSFAFGGRQVDIGHMLVSFIWDERTGGSFSRSCVGWDEHGMGTQEFFCVYCLSCSLGSSVDMLFVVGV